MKLISSIKHQTLLMFVGLSLALTALFLTLAGIAAFIVEDKIIFRLLEMEASHLERSYAQSGQLDESRLDFVDVFESKDALPTFIIHAIEKGTDDNEVFTATDEHYHFRELDLGEDKKGYLVAEVSPLLTVTTTPQFYGFFLIGVVLALVIGVSLAIKFASQTVQPVLEITAALKNKDPLPKLRYELGYLADTMQQAIDGLSRSLQREKDFSTDVNHELRTPLTILNNIVTLAENRGLTAEDLGQLRQVSRQMQHTIDVLFALARAESLDKQPCLLKSHVEQNIMQCMAAKRMSLDVELVIDDSMMVTCNPVLLDLLLTNLINNAITHGANEVLRIQASEKGIAFHNRSTASLSGDVTQRGIKGKDSEGIGQGLYLVTRIAELLGWQYRIENADAQFSVYISL